MSCPLSDLCPPPSLYPWRRERTPPQAMYIPTLSLFVTIVTSVVNLWYGMAWYGMVEAPVAMGGGVLIGTTSVMC